MRSKQCDNLVRSETSVLESGKDLVGIVEWLRDQQVRRGRFRFRAAQEKVELRSTRAVRDPNGTGELNAVIQDSEKGSMASHSTGQTYKSPVLNVLL